MWGFDMEDLIQVLVLVLIFGVGIIQFLYRTFVKPLVDAEAQKRQGGGPGQEPGKALRDFLAELRGETPQPRAESPEEAVAERAPSRPALERSPREAPEPSGEELIWEDVDEHRPGRHPMERRRPPADPRRGQRRTQRDGRRPSRKDRALRKARESVQEVLQEIDDDESYDLGERSVRSHLEEHLARRFSTLLEGDVPQGTSPAVASKRIPKLGGMGLREALLAQVILGPPRARQPRRGVLGWRQPV